MTARKTISKSAYLVYRQCPKYFWYYTNERSSLPEPDLRTKFNFKLGHIVGQLAKLCYPNGVEVGYNDFEQNLKKTQELLGSRKPLFEAGFLYKDNYCDLYSRADVLMPVNSSSESHVENSYKNESSENGTWDIVEVKSSTGVKEVNLIDVAFQKYCYQKAGINIRKCFLMYINNQYERNGRIDAKKLFSISEVTEAVDKIYPHIKNDLKQMLAIASNENFIYEHGEPEDSVGKFCDSPFNCPLKVKCWENVSKNSIFYLYSITKKTISKLYALGKKYINEIPDRFEGINYKQQIQINCVKNSGKHIDRQAIARYLEKIRYPVYFLDFETIASPIPLVDGTRPYQNIPFQFSLHVLKNPKGAPEHYSFLAHGDCDPRQELLDNLKEKFGFSRSEKEEIEDRENIEGSRNAMSADKADKYDFNGSVVVYNESFERAILRDLALYNPEHAHWIYSIMANIVDLYEPFKNFHYYNVIQKGSASVKKVLPALTGKSYEDMEISNGDIASVSFLEKSGLWKNFIREMNLFNFNGFVEDEMDEEKEIERIRNSLEEYCKLDTEGMLDIMQELEKLVNDEN